MRGPIPWFIWMHVAHCVIRNIHHASVLHFIDGMRADQSHASAFCDQNDVIAFQKFDKSYKTRYYNRCSMLNQIYSFVNDMNDRLVGCILRPFDSEVI